MRRQAARVRLRAAPDELAMEGIPLGALHALGEWAPPETPREFTDWLVGEMNGVRARLIAAATDASTFQNAWAWLVGGKTFPERVEAWNALADAWVRDAEGVVARSDPGALQAWAKVGVNIMMNAQDYANEIGDATLLARIGDFITRVPQSIASVYYGVRSGAGTVVDDLARGAGGVAGDLTWEVVKIVLLAAGGLGLAVYLLGKGAKAGGVSVATPWARIGG
jgi:hypothetical protein